MSEWASSSSLATVLLQLQAPMMWWLWQRQKILCRSSRRPLNNYSDSWENHGEMSADLRICGWILHIFHGDLLMYHHCIDETLLKLSWRSWWRERDYCGLLTRYCIQRNYFLHSPEHDHWYTLLLIVISISLVSFKGILLCSCIFTARPHRFQCRAERCISHCNFVCLSVCHTLVPCPDEWR